MGKYGLEKTPYLDTFHAVIDSTIVERKVSKTTILSSLPILPMDTFRTVKSYMSITNSYQQKQIGSPKMKKLEGKFYY